MRAACLCLGAVAVLSSSGCTSDVETGRGSYAQLCAGCHGASGQGDGPDANGLNIDPPDLTRIAARNGGVFPRQSVMAKIDGYARGSAHHGAMPAFWPLLDGRTVLVRTGDGILTPTPEPLVALTDYLESLQQ